MLVRGICEQCQARETNQESVGCAGTGQTEDGPQGIPLRSRQLLDPVEEGMQHPMEGRVTKPCFGRYARAERDVKTARQLDRQLEQC